MPNEKSKIFAQFNTTLAEFFDGNLSISGFLNKNGLLKQRYDYDPKTHVYACQGDANFLDYVHQSPEKDFYDLLNVPSLQSNLTQYLSESDCIQFYLMYRWAADFAHQNKLDSNWQTEFLTILQNGIYQQKRQNWEEIVLRSKSQWSAAKNKLFGFLVNNINDMPEIEQKIQSYDQLIEQAQQKKFYHDGTTHHLFHQHASAVSRYEYESMMHDFSQVMEPMLYYPESTQQQAFIHEYTRHALFVDKDTKELKYINVRGTVFTLPTNTLVAKGVDNVTFLKDKKWALPYKKNNNPNNILNFVVDKHQSEDFGTGFPLDDAMLKALVPQDFPTDPLLKLANKTLKATKNYFFSLQKVRSLFGYDQIIAFQHRAAALIQIKEMLQGKTTREIRETHSKPNMKDYMGRGRSTYVFFDHPDDPAKSELWHVDRSHDSPVMTQFPLQPKQVNQFCYMFSGARSEAAPLAEFENFELNQQWYQFGKAASQQVLDTKEMVLRLDEETARNIPKLVLSDMKIYQHLLEDRTYYETSNELTHLLETTEITSANKHLIQRCRTIHRQLELIEQDRLHAFPDSRGVVPPAKRQKIMQMMMDVIRDKDAPEARHYFRTAHRVYEEFQIGNLDKYEPSSFIWDGKNTVFYLDEHKNKIEVPMTNSIQRKLAKIMSNPNPAEQMISANDVYELMTRPRLFYYYCGIPICLDLRWLDFSQYVPLKWDRSQGLHTGTAAEMLRDIHEQKLSISNLLYKFGEVLILLVIPLILAAFGFVIPFPTLIGTLGAAIVNWVLMIWNIEYTFNYLRFTLTMNDLVQPELNQLDTMLQDLNEDVKKLTTLKQDIPVDGQDGLTEMDASTSPYSYLSYLR
jgi:hypothetical protein